jgi:hypothetical protein
MTPKLSENKALVGTDDTKVSTDFAWTLRTALVLSAVVDS